MPSDSPDDSGDDEDTSASMFKSFSKQWLHAQLHHHVSLSAASHFWKLAFQYVGPLMDLKAAEHNRKKIPGFLHERQVIHKDICPPVKMTFAFLDKSDNSVVEVHEDHTPLNHYERNPRYKKLYESAHIEVNTRPTFFTN